MVLKNHEIHNEMEEDDEDIRILAHSLKPMSHQQKQKIWNMFKSNFDDSQWEEDNSGDIE